MRNFLNLESRNDLGLLVENFVFQEILKFKTQHYTEFDIHYWRSKSGAEVDFVIHKNAQNFIPIEVKYRNMSKPTISRGYRSFIQAYQPKHALMITKELIAKMDVDGCVVHFVPLSQLQKIFDLIKSAIGMSITQR